MEVSKTLVALLTSASVHEHVDEEMMAEVNGLLGDVTRMEVVALLCSIANVSNYALDLLETNTQLTKSAFLQEMGQFFLENPEE